MKSGVEMHHILFIKKQTRMHAQGGLFESLLQIVQPVQWERSIFLVSISLSVFIQTCRAIDKPISQQHMTSITCPGYSWCQKWPQLCRLSLHLSKNVHIYTLELLFGNSELETLNHNLCKMAKGFSSRMFKPSTSFVQYLFIEQLLFWFCSFMSNSDAASLKSLLLFSVWNWNILKFISEYYHCFSHGYHT